MNTHNREADEKKPRFIDAEEKNSFRRLKAPTVPLNPTLTERVINFMDRYTAPKRGLEN